MFYNSKILVNFKTNFVGSIVGRREEHNRGLSHDTVIHHNYQLTGCSSMGIQFLILYNFCFYAED